MDVNHIYAAEQHRSLKRIRLYRQRPVSRVVLVYFGLLLVPVGFNLGSVYMTGTKA
ncbi:MAG TPA: O-antigen ligase domain-containing protein, partial [Sulfitobacter pontiacus]|nr:O-antigen ligase domain-containing protein [Sulfitobacter pontiacus]